MNKKNTYKTVFGFVILTVILALLVYLNLIYGSTGKITDFTEPTSLTIIKQIRLPRLLSAMILGGALSVSGFLLQTFFANPIAGPYILGISSGAKLTVALTMVFALQKGIFLGSSALIISSFIGSMLVMVFILIISGKFRNPSMLIIGGVMTGYICSAVTDIVVAFADDSNIVNLHNWSMGSFSGTDMSDVKTMSVITALSVLSAFLMSKPMGAYQLGESYAENMGVNIKLLRICLIILTGILSACVTAFAGPVSFVGIAVPHIVKTLFRTAKPIVIIPSAFLCGGAFCLLCDLIARTVFAPSELSISSVTALFGAPVVIAVMLKKRKNAHE
ncbi:MAG: iron ABC transporter permease [Ruminococcus sp.]|nr:iron ABC transporter permease [Ruminococcus sp.]